MKTLIESTARLERNLLWQTRTDPEYSGHQSRIAAMVEEGGVLRRCAGCGCALLHQEPVEIDGTKALKRCASCGSLEAK